MLQQFKFVVSRPRKLNGVPVAHLDTCPRGQRINYPLCTFTFEGESAIDALNRYQSWRSSANVRYRSADPGKCCIGES